MTIDMGARGVVSVVDTVSGTNPVPWATGGPNWWLVGAVVLLAVAVTVAVTVAVARAQGDEDTDWAVLTLIVLVGGGTIAALAAGDMSSTVRIDAAARTNAATINDALTRTYAATINTDWLAAQVRPMTSTPAQVPGAALGTPDGVRNCNLVFVSASPASVKAMCGDGFGTELPHI